MKSSVYREHSWQIIIQGMEASIPPSTIGDLGNGGPTQIWLHTLSSMNGEASHLSPISCTIWFSIKHLLTLATPKHLLKWLCLTAHSERQEAITPGHMLPTNFLQKRRNIPL